ncbi:Hypothetical predicted protein [Cloeon dipterum]|uniref:Inhibitor of growth protein N-terminal histone-binding domain-containing protein n=1 Tax=Cloeon dipterum TaxID=197152 RepID=A0A8S1D2K5_9INSE|nr:Hypothetical predicted protein [Cloeon dipterum]
MIHDYNDLTTGLEHLPIELQRNFTLLRDLDARAQNLMQTIDKYATEYLEGLAYPTNKSSSMSSDKKKELISNIQKMFNKSKEYGDDKVQLAIQTYELVDKHIRRLDNDLARFEAEIQEKAAASSSRSVEETPGNKSKSRHMKSKENGRYPLKNFCFNSAEKICRICTTFSLFFSTAVFLIGNNKKKLPLFQDDEDFLYFYLHS